MPEMHTSNYSIEPVTSSDLPKLSEYLHASKLALTINRLVFNDWPNDAAQSRQYTNAIEGAFKEPLIENLKVVDNESGEIIGFLVLSRKQAVPNTVEKPIPSEEKGKDAEVVEKKVPEGINPIVLKAVNEGAAKVSEGWDAIDHFEITYMYVKPANRRHGIGSQLVQICFDRAKTEGLPIFLASEPAAHAFFSKLGFMDENHFDFDLSQWAPPYSGFGLFRLAGMTWSN